MSSVGKLRLSVAGIGCLVASLSFGGITLDENFGDGGFPIGVGAKSYDGEKFVGDNRGSVFFDLTINASKAEAGGPRNLMCLRTAGRTRVALVTFGNRSLQFCMTDYDKTYLVNLPEPVEHGRLYRFGFTWDGEAMRLYRDGRVIHTSVQVLPLPLKNVRKLNFGPFKDGYIVLKPWSDDVVLRRVRVWDGALTQKQVAEDAKVVFRPVTEELPNALNVTRLPDGVAAPVIDGKADEKAWEYAASVPQLVRGNFPGKSGEMPEHGFRLVCDDANLYLLATTRFPGRIPYQEGLLRTPGFEPQAWGVEAWEFYLFLNGHKYRFTSTAAGGTSDRIDSDYGFSPDWKYEQIRAMKIDDSVVWTGEASIPWKSFGLDGPPKEKIRINFCRNWTLSTFGGFSSLDFTGLGYALNDTFPRTTFGPSASYRLERRTDPASGTYEEGYALSADRKSEVVYEVHYATRDGSQAPLSAFRRGYRMQAGETLSDSLSIPTSLPGYDALVHTLTQDGRVVMRESVPYDLNEEVAVVTPLLLSGKVRVSFKKPFSGRIALTGPGEKEFGGSASDGSETELAFSRDWPKGDYAVKLLAADGSAVAAKAFSYPGRGEWEKQDFHEDWILPPFTPLKSEPIACGLKAAMYGRAYGWRESFLPKQITSLGEKLLLKPVEIVVDGEAVAATEFTVTSNRPHHVGFAAKGGSVSSTGWLEYDGVTFNRVTVTPTGKGEIKVRYTLRPAFAKYLHCAAGGGWGSKITDFVNEGVRHIGKFPILWTGNEEKGLCFFYETRNGWTGDERKVYTLEKTSEGLTVTVNVTKDLPAGKPFVFEFGLLASPVRPRMSNYPFDTLGESYFSFLNRPRKRPLCDISVLTADDSKGGDHGSFYGDQDTPDGRKTDAHIGFILEKHEKGFGTRPVFYTNSRHLSVRYPEVAAYLPEWTFQPVDAMDYNNTGHFVYDCCPTTTASDFAVWRCRKMFERHPEFKGIYYDFGTVHGCSNPEHGCHDRIPILGMREFYRRHAALQVELGIKEPLIILHNTDCVQLPAFTFATHLLNGEHVRQASSSLLHDKKDICDTYGFPMFACELSTLPWGLSNAAYMPYDTLMAKFGGDEKTEPYEFRMGMASIGVLLAHDTMQCLWRNHIGLFDRVIRRLDAFGVDKAKFVGYWREPAKVTGGQGVIVSCWTTGKSVLAVVAHLDKRHDDQDVSITFDWSKLGLESAPKTATDLLPLPDPEGQWLVDRKKTGRIYRGRLNIEMGEFRSKVESFDGTTLKYHLPFHTFGLVELK